MRLRLTLVFALLLAAPVQAAGPADTRVSLERSARAAGSGSGVLAVDLDSGHVIASVRAESALIPASVTKLYTTAAALLRSGPDGRLLTRVLAAAGPDQEGTITGDLWLRGGGDPTLDPAGLARLAERVAEAGVLKVEGDLHADESYFDSLRGPPSERYRASVYIAPLSGLPFLRTWQPVKRVAVMFRSALKRAGVTVEGRALAGPAPDPATEIAVLESPAMSDLARRTNVPSDNWIAELLLKALGAAHGAKGSTAVGARVARATLARLGVRPRIADGSGLSRLNRTTPKQVVELLRRMDTDETVGPAFYDSLAVAGRTGTLHNRLRRTAAESRCRGKTGTIRGVSNLAGYCESVGGRRIAFAILMNRVNIYGARRLQDRMLSALARYSSS